MKNYPNCENPDPGAAVRRISSNFNDYNKKSYTFTECFTIPSRRID